MQIALGQIIIIIIIITTVVIHPHNNLHNNHTGSKICILYINIVVINIQNGEERQ
jgi:hypothetical protein